MKTIIGTLIFVLSMSAYASLETCSDLYIGKIRSQKGIGLYRFTLVENPQGTNATNGGWSNWIYLSDWEKEDKAAVLSTILAAKMAGKKVSINTEASDGCGITNTSELSSIVLQVSQ